MQKTGNTFISIESYGWLPIQYASEHQHLDLVKLFIKSGADVNVKGR